MWLINLVGLLFTGLLVLSAFLTFGAICIQAYIYSQQRELMEKTLKYSARAFLYAKDAFIIGGRGKEDVPAPDRPGFVCVTFENTGNTPARNVTVDVNTIAISGELPEDFSYPSFKKASGPKLLVGPKASPQTTVPIDDVTLGEIYSGAKRFFVYGTTTYEDIFGDSHKTQFCFRYNNAVLNENGTISKTIFGPCAKHNCDDENCPEKWGDNDAGLRPR